MTGTRRRRGSETQNLAATWFATHGWPYAQSAGAGRPGTDVLGVPGVSVEVKARRDWQPLAWCRQAAKTPGLPIVIARPDGAGPASIADWPVIMRLEDATALLQEAGYGDGVA